MIIYFKICSLWLLGLCCTQVDHSHSQLWAHSLWLRARELSCPVICEIFPDQGTELLCPLLGRWTLYLLSQEALTSVLNY